MTSQACCGAAASGRHQQRARDKLATSLEAAQKRIAKQVEAIRTKQEQVAESVSQGHGRRLAQRQRALRALEKSVNRCPASPRPSG